MGRSFSFNVDSVEFPAEKPACAAQLETLQPGQRVRITCDHDAPASQRVHRSPSSYGCTTSSFTRDLVVDDINVDPALNKHGVRAIAFRNPTIPKDEHFYTWYVTTDGYVRECEHYGIMKVIASVKVLESVEVPAPIEVPE